MRRLTLLSICGFVLGLGSLEADTKLAAPLKSATATVSNAADAAKKKTQDSLQAVAAAAAKHAADSAKAVAAALEAKAKHEADSIKAATEAALKMKKDTAKAVVVPAKEEKATVTEATPAPKTAPVAAKGCGVAKIAFGTAVENKEIKGESAELAAGRAHCWTRLACGGGAIKVHHVWYKDGKKAQDVALSCKSASGRVWSNAPVTAGQWKVEVVKDSGEVMGSGEFTVK